MLDRGTARARHFDIFSVTSKSGLGQLLRSTVNADGSLQAVRGLSAGGTAFGWLLANFLLISDEDARPSASRLLVPNRPAAPEL